MVDYDRRLRKSEDRAVSAANDEHGELLRKWNAELIPPDELAVLRSQTPDPEFQASFAALLAAAMAAQSKR